MGVYNVLVDKVNKKITVENRRSEVNLRSDYTVMLNEQDKRPYVKIDSPIASIIDDKGDLITDDKLKPIDIVADVAVSIDPVLEVKK